MWEHNKTAVFQHVYKHKTQTTSFREVRLKPCCRDLSGFISDSIAINIVWEVFYWLELITIDGYICLYYIGFVNTFLSSGDYTKDIPAIIWNSNFLRLIYLLYTVVYVMKKIKVFQYLITLRNKVRCLYETPNLNIWVRSSIFSKCLTQTHDSVH